MNEFYGRYLQLSRNILNGIVTEDFRGRWYFGVVHCLVAKSCPTLCDPMNCSTPGLPVHQQLPEPTQTHVHQVGDAIQSSHALSSPSSPALNPSQHQGLYKWVSSSYQVPKVLKFQLQHQSYQWIPRTDKEEYQIECRIPENSKERYEGLIKWTVQRSRGNNTMGKTQDLIKKIRAIKGAFHVRMGTIKVRKGKGPKRCRRN